jgi:hypothetical protein
MLHTWRATTAADTYLAGCQLAQSAVATSAVCCALSEPRKCKVHHLPTAALIGTVCCLNMEPDRRHQHLCLPCACVTRQRDAAMLSGPPSPQVHTVGHPRQGIPVRQQHQQPALQRTTSPLRATRQGLYLDPKPLALTFSGFTRSFLRRTCGGGSVPGVRPGFRPGVGAYCTAAHSPARCAACW